MNKLLSMNSLRAEKSKGEKVENSASGLRAAKWKQSNGGVTPAWQPV